MQSVENIGFRFWYMTPVEETDRPILGMVIGNEKSLMIDAGNSEAHTQYFLQELAKRHIPKPKMVVLTHWHWDHIFGLSALEDVISISSIETKKEMEKLIPYSWTDEALDERVKEGTEIEFCATAIKKEYGPKREITITLPDITFKERMEIDLGGVTCVLKHVGGDHADDSIVVYIKEEKILFLGDCLYPNIYSAKTNYTVEKTLKLLKDLEEFDAETYVLSHWKPISKSEFEKEVDVLKTIAQYTEIFNGDQTKMKEAYQKQVGRELNEDELDTIECFVNG